MITEEDIKLFYMKESDNNSADDDLSLLCNEMIYSLYESDKIRTKGEIKCSESSENSRCFAEIEFSFRDKSATCKIQYDNLTKLRNNWEEDAGGILQQRLGDDYIIRIANGKFLIKERSPH